MQYFPLKFKYSNIQKSLPVTKICNGHATEKRYVPRFVNILRAPFVKKKEVENKATNK